MNADFAFNKHCRVAFILAAEALAIRQAMAGFALPSSAVPQWAHVVPEDVWKAKLIGGLKKSKDI